MSKTKYRKERGSAPVSRHYGFKLGNRKSTTSAHTVPTAELLKMYFSGNTPKNKPKIAKILRLRGVELVDPALAIEEAQAA